MKEIRNIIMEWMILVSDILFKKSKIWIICQINFENSIQLENINPDFTFMQK